MANVVQVTELGQEHGMVNQVANSVTNDGFTYMTPEGRSKAEKKQKEDSKIISARYMNRNDPVNGKLEMQYCLGGGKPIQSWRFLSGHEYDMPMGLVNQVNKSELVQRDQKIGKDGVASTKASPAIKVHEFVPTKF